ncbi:LysR family transcriptional regulator [Chromobacterium violaceum]|uniref:LysR family transcriptional regulator n=1 Tax=Chromobacterium violaceum TaxID=536 RepID=UPI00195189D0|nr:LysR family transcriptional regulator [Chromobacterium violaceum]QRO34572.1 LysR family transcriptional regulator [Chromobacterium violaceum]QRQ15623.1 LysR family transcriptional regulator [Chromobacterium violaceum]
MDRFHWMSVFVAVAEEEAFAGAARRLKLSPPAVTRAVAALEENLGVRLLNRTTRYVRVTEAGARYLDDARRILAAVEEAEETAAGINAEPRGLIRLTAPMLFGRLYVMPAALDFLRQYPQVEVEALLQDRLVNLMEEGLDAAVRIGHLPDSSLRAIKVGEVRRVTCASPDYLARHGEPETPEALGGHAVIASTAASSTLEWKFGPGGGHRLRVRPRLAVSSNDAAIDAACGGFGVTRVMSYQVAEALAAGKLKRVLVPYESEPLPIHIVHAESRHGSTRMRRFIDFLAERLRADPRLTG